MHQSFYKYIVKLVHWTCGQNESQMAELKLSNYFFVRYIVAVMSTVHLNLLPCFHVFTK